MITCDCRYLTYTEDISKTNHCGVGHIKVTGKVVRAYENMQQLDRCIVKLYQTYVSHRPFDPKCAGNFYLRPLANPRGDVWYSCQPVGRFKLSQVMSDIAKRPKMEGKVTNHSLCVTAASRLYQNNVDEQLVMETTGHRSTSSVRSYKRTSEDQMATVSDVLYGYTNGSNVSELIGLPVKHKVDDVIGSGVQLGKENVPCKKAQMDYESVTDVKPGTSNNVTVKGGDQPLCFNFTVNITK